MYGQLRREDTADGKKTSALQKPSPSSGDDATKGEYTQNTTEGNNSSRYARKKCGLKPIRPATMSASCLNPTTPGRLPQTPRLNFKENEYSKSGIHEYPVTPKFGRSESTPELHRIRKMDHLLMSSEKVIPTEKMQDNLLRESQATNLSNMSDSLPDIFRRPIAQPSTAEASLNFLTKPTEEKVSKWGYGPSSFFNNLKPPKTSADAVKETHKPSMDINQMNSRNLKEETIFSNKTSTTVSSNTAQKVKTPLTNNCDNSSQTSLQPVFSTTSLVNSIDKLELNRTSDTASALGFPTQITVKAQPMEMQLITPVKNFSTNNQSSTLPTLSSELKKSDLLLTTPTNSAKTIASAATNPFGYEPPASSLNAPSLKPISSTKDAYPSAANEQAGNQNKLGTALNILPTPISRPPKTKQFTVNGKHYTVMKPLGRGGSSVVFQVLNPDFTDIYALKVVRLDSVDEGTAEGYINEVRLLKQLQCLPRVVRLIDYEYNEDEEKLLLIMEKGDTDFASVIRNRTSQDAINPTLIRFFWQEMLEAVGEIHNKNVIHSDLKPANFLLVNGGLKLIDFGIATSIQADMTSILKDSQCGTYNYMAPEAIKSTSPVGAIQEYKISRKTDVWSLGCILYSLMYKNPPFSKFRDTIEKINAIIDERYVIEFPSYPDPTAVEVVKMCLDRNPRYRPTIEQLLSHPFLTCSEVSSANIITSTSLRSRLEPFMKDNKLCDEAKDIIRQWF